MAAAAMAAEEVEDALGLFTGIGLSEAKARETLRNGALSALLRRAVLQVRPPWARTLVPGPRSPVPRHPDVTSGPGYPGNSVPQHPGTGIIPGTRYPDPRCYAGTSAPWSRCHPLDPSLPGTFPASPPPDPAERPWPLALPCPAPVPGAAGSPWLGPRSCPDAPRGGGRLGARWARRWTNPPGHFCTIRPPA